MFSATINRLNTRYFLNIWTLKRKTNTYVQFIDTRHHTDYLLHGYSIFFLNISVKSEAWTRKLLFLTRKRGCVFIYPRNQCFGSVGSGSDSFLSPDPDWPKKRPKTRIKVEKILYFISSTSNTVLFHQALPEPYQNHYLDHISLQNGRIRTFKTRIQIGEKTRIQNTVRNGNRSFFNSKICVFFGLIYVCHLFRLCSFCYKHKYP